MDYRAFVSGRQALWQRLEQGLVRLRATPRATTYTEIEELAALYRQALHDQALAQARFAGTQAAARLQRLCLEGTFLLRREDAAAGWSVVRFFGATLPRAMRLLLPRLALAAAVFGAAAVLGLMSTLANPESASALLGARRISELQQGEIWTDSITSAAPPAVTSSAIATNNISVSLLAWGGGAVAGLGAVYVLLLNGFMLGATFGVVSHFGMAGRLGEFVAAHGPLEITIILVCAAAGLGVGKALVVASDRPRGEAVREESMAALAVLAYCVPWLVVLGVVESVVSPSPQMWVVAKVSVGLVLWLVFALAALRPGRWLSE